MEMPFIQYRKPVGGHTVRENAVNKHLEFQRVRCQVGESTVGFLDKGVEASRIRGGDRELSA